MRRCVGAMLVMGAMFVMSALPGASDAAAAVAEPNTVSVQGVARAPIAQGASTTEADAAYRQAMAAAIADGLEKAEFLAARTGRKLSEGIDQVQEDGGSIECTNVDGSYAEYTGAQADFGYPQESAVTPATAAPSAGTSTSRGAKPSQKKKKKRKGKKTPKARGAAAVSCTVSAEVSLVYDFA